jgi:hypothetical protein
MKHGGHAVRRLRENRRIRRLSWFCPRLSATLRESRDLLKKVNLAVEMGLT